MFYFINTKSNPYLGWEGVRSRFSIRKHLDEIPFMSAERAKELDNIPDENIDYSDIPPLDEGFFKKAKRVERTLKKQEKIQPSP